MLKIVGRHARGLLSAAYASVDRLFFSSWEWGAKTTRKPSRIYASPDYDGNCHGLADHDSLPPDDVGSVTTISLFWIVSILLICAVHTAFIGVFLRRLRRDSQSDGDEAPLPVAAVILCLRGIDPFLRECLQRLAAQDYPEFEIWIVLDSPADPANRMVRDWLAESRAPNVHLVHVEEEEQSNQTSLKTNSLRYAITRLGEHVEVAVLIDADTLTHPRWLRQMIAPLADESVGVVSGHRWYSPDVRNMGSLIRFIYNAFAVVPMEQIRAVWAGSLSLRREVFADPEFVKCLRSAACEDAVITDGLRRTGLQLAYTYDCILLNREETSLAGCFRFIHRQLLWTRLCNPSWGATLLGTMLVFANVVCGGLLLSWAAVHGHTVEALAVTTTFVAVAVFHFVLLQWLHRSVSERMAKAYGQPPVVMTWGIRLRLAAAIIVTLPFYTLAALAAALARRIHWRGVTYAVEPPGIRMLAYTPYAEDPGNPGSVYSL